MSSAPDHWTAGSLQSAIACLDPENGLSVTRVSGSDVLELTLADAGDFVLHVAVGEAQILTSALLWPRSAQDDPEAFEALMLRSHKALLPLCALSIDRVDGEEYYELFGAMSCNAALEEIIKEFALIADSALELARDIGPRAHIPAEDAS